MVAKQLAPRQQVFVEEYLVDLNATQAAIRAGYSAKTAVVQGPRLLGNVRVQAAISDAAALRAERTNTEADWVVAKLVENVERAMCNRPVLDKDGEPIGEFVYDGQVANAALKLLGEHLRWFPSKFNILQDNRTLNMNGGDGGGPVTFMQLVEEANKDGKLDR